MHLQGRTYKQCGAAPLRIETERIEGFGDLKRKCPFCENIEHKSHVFHDCFMYNILRRSLFEKAYYVECLKLNN